MLGQMLLRLQLPRLPLRRPPASIPRRDKFAKPPAHITEGVHQGAQDQARVTRLRHDGTGGPHVHARCRGQCALNSCGSGALVAALAVLACAQGVDSGG